MKVICITGQFGSGKTTAVGIMARCLPNSAAIYGDGFLVAALLQHQKEFEEIYQMPLDEDHPTASLRAANDKASPENIAVYRRFCEIFMPSIENEIEKAVAAERRQGKSFVVVEYVGLASFAIWRRADYRVVIKTDDKLRAANLYRRDVAKRSYNEGFERLREKVFAEIIRKASGVDFIVENNFDEVFEKDLSGLCQAIEKGDGENERRNSIG
jgi:uridine kinase